MSEPRQLSPREIQVLRCLADDHSQKEAAQILSIQVTTVRSYLARARAKLGVRTTAAAIYVAIQTRLM